MKTKECGKCKLTKNIDQFHNNKSTKTGYSSRCKTCKSLSDATYRNANRNKILKKKQEYYCNGGKEVLQQWYVNNPEKVLAKNIRARAKRRSKENLQNLPSKDFKVWLGTQIKLCVYCGCNCSSDFEIEHISPLSKEGQHELSNLAIVCHTCNQSKGSKELLHWLAWKNL